MTFLVAAVSALLGFVAQWIVQKFVLDKTREQERAMHRATLAAAAFAEFFEAISRNRTVAGTIENDAEGDGPPLTDPTEFTKVVDGLNAARGKLAAVASPQVINKLAELDAQGGPGLTARSIESQRVLTEIMGLLRGDLGVGRAGSTEELRVVLFGSQKPPSVC